MVYANCVRVHTADCVCMLIVRVSADCVCVFVDTTCVCCVKCMLTVYVRLLTSRVYAVFSVC